MFGIGFTEFLLIFVIAILFLGPDKLPQALVDMAKFIKGVKQSISEAKSSFEEEVKVADLKEEALEYKRQLDEATHELQNFKNIDFDDLHSPSKQLNTPLTPEEEPIIATPIEAQSSEVTFKKMEKKLNIKEENQGEKNV